MQNKTIFAIAVTFVLVLGAGSFWVWKISQPNTVITKRTTDAAAPTSNTLPTTAATGALTVPTGNAQAQAQAPPNSSQQQSSNVVLDPTKFSTYDQYKDQQTASYADISVGTGAEAVAGKKAIVNYRGWLTNGKVFDENVDAAKPFGFTLGAGGVIAGWEQGIAGMKVGGERLLIVPSAVGYGPTGSGPIPGNAVLVFDVKLIAVE